MDFNFDEILEIKDMNSEKWECMSKIDSRAKAGTLAFWVADMDFPCAPVILDAIKERIDKRILGYTTYKTEPYFKSVKNWYKRDFGWEIEKENIFFSPGVAAALSTLVNLLTDKGDGVIIQRPVYRPFSKVVENNGRVVVNNRLINNGGHYKIDLKDLEIKCRHNKLLILCSPHNPVGRVWTPEELLAIGKICKDNGVIIISDEIHCDLTRLNVRHHILETLLPEYKNNIITCTAPSKTFNIAGMAQSHIVINDPAIKKKWENYITKTCTGSVNPLSVAAAKAAFDHGQPWTKAERDYIDKNMGFIEDFIKSELPEAGFVKPDGTYLAWIDFRKFGKTSGELFGLMLEKGGIMLQKGTDFGAEEGEGFMRLNAACPRKLLEEGLFRVKKSLE